MKILRQAPCWLQPRVGLVPPAPRWSRQPCVGFATQTTILEEELKVAKTWSEKVRGAKQNDPALDAFDELWVRYVSAGYGHNASAFLAQFQSTAASLEPGERIELDVVDTDENSMEFLKAALADPQANKICALRWWYGHEEDANTVLPLLIDSCPELALLKVYFKHHSTFDFASSVLEHPNNKIKVLALPLYTKGNVQRFFAALGQSQVSALTIRNCDPLAFCQGLCEYLAKDLLVRLEIETDEDQVPPEVTMSLAKCTRLAQLKWVYCEFSQSTAFPKSITKLELENCTFADGFDWSFLADSNVRELDLHEVEGVDGNQLGDALAVCLRAKGLDNLRFAYCDCADETLAVVGVELGRIKRLETAGHLSDASIELIALTLQSPDSELQELELPYDDDTTSSIVNHVVPALKHPNCNLTKLSLRVLEPELEAAAKTIEDMFYNRLALLQRQ